MQFQWNFAHTLPTRAHLLHKATMLCSLGEARSANQISKTVAQQAS